MLQVATNKVVDQFWSLLSLHSTFDANMCREIKNKTINITLYFIKKYKNIMNQLIGFLYGYFCDDFADANCNVSIYCICQ
jgi:hypothetical protein